MSRFVPSLPRSDEFINYKKELTAKIYYYLYIIQRYFKL